MEDEVIVLSDESVSSREHDVNDQSNNKQNQNEDFMFSGIEFPEIEFGHSQAHGRDINEREKSFHDNLAPIYHDSPRKRSKQAYAAAADSPESQNNSDNDIPNFPTQTQKSKASKKDKTKVAEERIQRQQQLARNKALKAIAAKKLRDIKPGECMKFMSVTLDEGIRNFGITTDITDALQNSNIKHVFHTQLIPNSITWKRNVEESYLNENNIICTETNIEEIDQFILIWNWDEAVAKVADNSFCASINSIRSLLPDYHITLVIFGIQEYFAYRKDKNGCAQKKSKSKERKGSKDNSVFKDLPEISRHQLETCLVEIQILYKCNSRLVESSQDLALMISQYTKSIAEIPYKKEMHKNLKDKFDWYVMGDNRDTVKVDKTGNGLKRLWEQQLQQFNASSLEVAHAISSMYPSPASLIEAYSKCTESDGMNLLKDIPIRRAAGPLTATRKIGIELSKKIYTMFVSKDGDDVL